VSLARIELSWLIVPDDESVLVFWRDRATIVIDLNLAAKEILSN